MVKSLWKYSIEKSSTIDFFNTSKVYTETDRKNPKWSNLAWNFYGPFGLKWISVYSSVSNGRISFKHSNQFDQSPVFY